MTPEEREALLAGHALGSLSARDAIDADRLIRTDPSAAAEYEAYRELSDLIALSVPMRRADPSLRERVLTAARGERSRWRSGWVSRRHLPVAGLAAALAIVTIWAMGLQQSVNSLEEQTVMLTSVLEAEAKRIEAMEMASRLEDDSQAQGMQLELERVLSEQQAILAVQADPEVLRVELEATRSSFGAGGQYLWSDSANTGILLVQNLPPLPIGAEYKVWVRDALGRLELATSFSADEQGNAQVVIQPEEYEQPDRLYLIANDANNTSSDGPIVLQGRLDRAEPAEGDELDDAEDVIIPEHGAGAGDAPVEDETAPDEAGSDDGDEEASNGSGESNGNDGVRDQALPQVGSR